MLNPSFTSMDSALSSVQIFTDFAEQLVCARIISHKHDLLTVSYDKTLLMAKSKNLPAEYLYANRVRSCREWQKCIFNTTEFRTIEFQ